MNPKSLQKIGYGLYVVTSVKDGKFNGQIANTVFQITSEPPTIAVSINKNNLTWEYIKASRCFAISVLCKETPLSFIGHFGFKSGRDSDKLEGVKYKIGQTKVPIVTENAVAVMELRVTQEMDVGTHTIFVGELVDADVINDERCMTYEHYHEVKRGTTPKSAPTYIPEKREGSSATDKYRCSVCGWLYDPKTGYPEGGIAPGTPFEKIPDSWTCPVCGAPRSSFAKSDN